MRRPYRVGHPHHHVVERRRAVGGDVADQRDDLVLRAVHRGQLVDGRAHRPAGADRHDQRMRRLEPALELGGGGLRDPRRAGRRIGVAGHDLAAIEGIAVLEALRQVEAAGDRVIEADLDQLLADRERHQPLRRLPRHAELAGDFVLGVAGDVVKPTGPGCIVQPRFLVVRGHPPIPLKRPAHPSGRAASPPS